jgi:hypothetical protein
MTDPEEPQIDPREPPDYVLRPETYAALGEPIMRHFKSDHLQPPLCKVSVAFEHLAFSVLTLPKGDERDTSLRKLLEGRDAALRAALDLPDE